MHKNLFNSNLLKQEVAVGSYLDLLLHEATHDPARQEAEAQVVPLKRGENLIASDLLTVEIDQSPTNVVGSVLTEPVVINPDTVQVQHTEAQEPEPQSVTLEPGMFPLQCLMFQVAGNRLSVPLIRMKSVLPWVANLTVLPHSPTWMLGLFKYQGHSVRVVDSSQILGIDPAPDSVPGHVLILGNDVWAITCDKLEDVIMLEYSDIQWNRRQDNSMIFGTIRNSLANLLNPDGIVNSLKALNLDWTG